MYFTLRARIFVDFWRPCCRAERRDRPEPRDREGFSRLSGLQFTCFLLGCNVIEGVNGALGQVFVLAPGPFSSVTTLLSELLANWE